MIRKKKKYKTMKMIEKTSVLFPILQNEDNIVNSTLISFVYIEIKLISYIFVKKTRIKKVAKSSK